MGKIQHVQYWDHHPLPSRIFHPKKCLPEVSTVIVRWFRSVLQMGRSLRLLDSWTSYDTLIPSGNFFRLAMDKNRYVITNITNHQQKYGFPWFPSITMVLKQWQHASSVVVSWGFSPPGSKNCTESSCRIQRAQA